PFPHENGTVWTIAEAPEGLLLLDRVGGRVARLRDTTGAVRAKVQVPADPVPFDGVRVSPDAKRLAVIWRGPDAFSMWVYDFSRKQPARWPGFPPGHVWSLVFSPDGTRLASASDDDTARLWDVATGRPIGAPLSHGVSRLLSAAFRPDGARVV